MTKPFTAFTNETIDAANLAIPAGQVVNAATSPVISNDSGTIYNSFKLTLEYSGLSPKGVGSYSIGCVVEAADSQGNYSPIHYQFSPYNGFAEAEKRILIMQPNMDTFNLGIDDIVYPVNREEARISREQGALPESDFRIVVQLLDNDPNGPNAFQQVTVNAAGELYNV